MNMTIQQLHTLFKSQPQVKIQDFCETWIPKLYDVQPDEYGYKKACINELVRLLKGTVRFETISRNWKWGSGDDKYTGYIEPLLDLAHQRYSVLDAMGELRKYS